jgi:hypothetical protein
VASQAAILTLQAHIEITIELNPSQVPSSVRNNSMMNKYVMDYLRSGKKERIKEDGPLGNRDLIRDFESGKGSELRPKPPKNGVAQGTLDVSNNINALEVWQWLLFGVPDSRLTLAELLTQGEAKGLKETVENGRSLVYLDMLDSRSQRYEIWLDPGTNYLARKVVCHWTRPRGSGRTQCEALAYREMKPGLFFPERVKYTMWAGNEWCQKGESVLTNIRVNEPLAPGSFKHVFPVGTMVADVENGKGYIVGRDHQPSHVGTLAPQTSYVVSGQTLQTSTPADADQKPWWSWENLLLIGSGVLLAVGVAGYWWKRRAKSKS